jgi:HEXXH motif-containing protein
MISTHTLARADFEALASGLGDVSTIGVLRAGQHSKHVLQLRALFDAAGAGMREILKPGLALLSATQQSAPAITADLLLHPPVGGWLAHCLRRLGGGGDPPAETDLAHLSAIAAAAALRADMDFTIRVPCRSGTLMLPSLGLARINGLAPDECVTVTGQAGRPGTVHSDGGVVIRVDPDSDARGWMAVRRVKVDHPDWPLRIFLDELDPFRDCHGSGTTGRLDSKAFGHWRARLHEAWSLLTQFHPTYARCISTGLRSVVPLRTQRPGCGTTATSPDSFGACLMSEPADAAGLAVGLVHEFQHAKLGALMDLIPLHTADQAARYYAPWRDDPRPLGGLLHGTYAFLAVTDFWRVQRMVAASRAARFAHFEFARRRMQSLDAVRTLQSSGHLTELGVELVDAIRNRLRAWAAEEVPAEASAAARDAIADHRADWRLRNPRATSLTGMGVQYRTARGPDC